MIDDKETRQAFAEAISAAFLAVSKPTPSKPMLLVYWQVLKGYELDDVQRAIAKHLGNPDTGMFEPKPADVVRMIEGDTRTRVALAWSQVENAIRRVGPYPSVVFDDPLTQVVLEEMGGWPLLNTVTLDELPFKAKEFETRYRALCQQPPATHPRVLPGLSEGDCVARGLPAPAPALIGNFERARQVYALGTRGHQPQIRHVKDAAALLANLGLEKTDESQKLT